MIGRYCPTSPRGGGGEKAASASSSASQPWLKESWYRDMDRNAAEAFLADQQAGAFVVRPSSQGIARRCCCVLISI